MPKTIFLCAWTGERTPDVPALDDLRFTEGSVLKGGWSLVSQAPANPPTCLVLVETSAARLDEMKADPARWPWWEDCAE